MTRLMNWLYGWRRDLDGFLVRARRASDPVFLPSHVGFLEEACIAVRTHEQARAVDQALSPVAGGGEK